MDWGLHQLLGTKHVNDGHFGYGEAKYLKTPVLTLCITPTQVEKWPGWSQLYLSAQHVLGKGALNQSPPGLKTKKQQMQTAALSSALPRTPLPPSLLTVNIWWWWCNWHSVAWVKDAAQHPNGQQLAHI